MFLHVLPVAGLELLVPNDTLGIQPHCTGFIGRIVLNKEEGRKSGLVWLLQSYFPYKASTGKKQQRNNRLVNTRFLQVLTDWLTPDFLSGLKQREIHCHWV